MYLDRASDQPTRRPLRGSGGFADATALVLERAKASRAIQGRAMLPVELRDAIIQLCVQAHAERMTIERVIVQLKNGWGAIPEFRRLPRGGDHNAVLACVITQCILDFYAERQQPGARMEVADSAPIRRGPE